MKKFLLSLTALLVLGLLCSFALADGDSYPAGDPYSDPTRVHTLELVFEDEDVEVLSYTPETCTKNGFIRFKCRYGEQDATKFHWHEWVIPAHHVWSDEEYIQDPDKWGRVIKEPNCTETGLAEGYCLVCGITHVIDGEELTREIAPLGHRFNKWVVDEAPNCKFPGKAHLICSICGIDKTPMTYYDSGDEALAAEYVEENLTLARTKKPNNRLSRADYVNVFKGVLADPYGHDWDGWVIEQEPTCAKEGVRVRWCKICGDKQLDIIPTLTPKYEMSKVRLMNCYWEELTETCIYCKGAVHPDQYMYREVVAHEYDISDDEWLAYEVEPTCTEKGYKDYYCVHCLEDMNDPEGNEIVHKDYDIEDPGIIGEDPDGEFFRVYLNPLGHDYTDWELRHAPGEGANEYGYWVRTCKRCFKTEEYVSKTAPTGTTNPDNGEPVHVDRNGLAKDTDGAWKLFKNDKVDTVFTGVLAYDSVEFFVTKGVVDTDAQGLNLFDNTWYFLADGQVKRGYDGFAEYNNNWFIIKNGELDPTANGLFAYDGGTFLFAAGRLRTDVSGLWQDAKGDWFYLSNGQVQTQHSGVVEYDGAFFVVKEGKLDKTAEGTIEYDGKTFNVVAGQLYAPEAEAAA